MVKKNWHIGTRSISVEIKVLRKLGAHFRVRGKALEAFAFVVTHALLITLIYVPVYALAAASLFSAR